VQPIGSMGQKIAMFMNCAALDQGVQPQCSQRFLKAWSAIDDDEFRRAEAAFDEIIEKRPPSGFAFAARRLILP
jgi:hypothetical protein